MADEEVIELVGNGERNSGLKFDAEATAFLISATNGSPYLSNLLCHGAGMAALDDMRSNVTVEDVSTALENALDDLRGRLPVAVAARLDAEPERVRGEPADSESGDSPRGKHGAGRGQEAKRLDNVLSKLEAEGLLEPSMPTRYALVADTVAPYLQLVTARSRLRIASARRGAKAE
jgi:hypothetical protein